MTICRLKVMQPEIRKARTIRIIKRVNPKEVEFPKLFKKRTYLLRAQEWRTLNSPKQQLLDEVDHLEARKSIKRWIV